VAEGARRRGCSRHAHSQVRRFYMNSQQWPLYLKKLL
jgi:hypothetical protein